jgi:MFS transporter, AAHS family, 4-hydroxybenzoate transporter
MKQVIDLNGRIEANGVGRLSIFTICLCFSMMLADGFDYSTLTVAAPAIMREWGLQPKDIGGVFSITFFGLLVGSLTYGWAADSWGRRPTIILGTFNFGIPILLSGFTADVGQLSVLRFIGGIGIGGVVPIVYTLVSEYAPRRSRSTVTVLTNTGYSLGGVLTGLLAAVLIPTQGWRSLFLLGGAFSIAMGFTLFALLPESVLFLSARRPRSPRLRPLVRRLLPHETIAPDAEIVARDEQQDTKAARGSVRDMFTGARGLATPLLWLLFIADSLGFFFLASWLPVLMEAAGVSRATASLAQSIFTFAGLCGGLIMMRLIDRRGPIAIVALPVIGAPVEILMGAPGLPKPALLICVMLAGLCLQGIHYSVYAIVVRFYPPSVRGRGVSFATVFGRGGGIIAPYIGGYLLSAHMPLQRLMIFAALPCIVTAVVGMALGRLHDRHFRVPEPAAA